MGLLFLQLIDDAVDPGEQVRLPGDRVRVLLVLKILSNGMCCGIKPFAGVQRRGLGHLTGFSEKRQSLLSRVELVGQPMLFFRYRVAVHLGAG